MKCKEDQEAVIKSIAARYTGKPHLMYSLLDMFIEKLRLAKTQCFLRYILCTII